MDLNEYTYMTKPEIQNLILKEGVEEVTLCNVDGLKKLKLPTTLKKIELGGMMNLEFENDALILNGNDLNKEKVINKCVGKTIFDLDFNVLGYFLMQNSILRFVFYGCIWICIWICTFWLYLDFVFCIAIGFSPSSRIQTQPKNASPNDRMHK